MTKKIIIGIFLVILGGVIGAGVYIFIWDKTASKQNSFNSPPVAKKIVEDGKAFSEVVGSVSPTVVNIAAIKVYNRADFEQNDKFFDLYEDFLDRLYDNDMPRNWREHGLGTGVIVSSDGYIITNNHVVSDAEQIKVTLFDKKTISGKVVGVDPKTDIAVIKVDLTDLPTVPFGDSDKLKVGEYVLAIGNPFGLSHTVTMGIISAVGRANVGIAEYEDFIQTDAAINPGNSGGPLVDTDGTLIGINTAIFSGSGGYQGIGFAVPSNMVKQIMEQLIKDGRVIRGWLGISIQELTPELASKFGYDKTTGALVDEITPGGPADRAGIKKGDIIVNFKGKPSDSPSSLKNLVAGSRPGEQNEVVFYRNKKTIKTVVTVTEPPKEAQKANETQGTRAERQNAFAGVSVSDITKDIARQLGIDYSEGGIVVVRVQPGSLSDDAGLRRGDIIYEMEGKGLKNLNEFSRAITNHKQDEPVLLYISRGGRKFFITINPY